MNKSLGLGAGEPLLDSELDQLLSAASTPPLLVGFEQRLLHRMAAQTVVTPRDDNVVPFIGKVKQAPAQKPVLRRAGIAAALAASLVFGAFLSNVTDISSFVDGINDLATTGQVAEFTPTGLDDIGKLDGEIQS